MRSKHTYFLGLSSLLMTLFILQACIDEVSISLSSSDLYRFDTDSTFKPLDQRIDATIALESCDPNQVAWVQPKLNQGVCQNSKKFCINGYFQEPNYDQIQYYEQTEKTCDALDNDCDGFVDEMIVTEIECGTGVCQNTGKRICKDGQILTECEEKPMLNVLDDDCNGKDDNCDGQIDDGFVQTSIACGAGFCSAMGLKVCIDGEVKSTCTPQDILKKENDMNCDGIDEDCDGKIDEDYMIVPISCNQGLCERMGQRTCINGQQLNDCERISPNNGEVDASCNGQDDDCDGRNDEGYMSSMIVCGQGLCMVQGSLTCRDGQISERCQPFISSFSSDSICNGQDEDCDGMVDEDYQGTITSCGTGICQTTGVMSCENGLVTNTCSALSGTAEICNMQDDDCDGLADENLTRSTSCGLGACFRMGLEICTNGDWRSQCQPGLAGTEFCNMQDDNCDGIVDNVPLKDTSCIPDRDITASSICSYTYQCDYQTTTLVCKSIENNQRDLCNGQDDNCDGRVDEDERIGVGECSVSSMTGISTSCRNQAWTCRNGNKVCDAMSCNGM